MLGGVLPYAPATEAAAPAAPDQVQMEIGVTTTETIEDDTFEDNAWNRNGQSADGPPSAGGAGGGGAGFSPSWKIARLNCHLESEHLLNLALPWYADIAISICFTWYSPGVLVAFHFVQHPTRKTQQTANGKISRWIIYNKKGCTDVQRRPDLVFHVSFMFLLDSMLSHLRTISWITGRFKISASDRSGGSKVRIHRWDPPAIHHLGLHTAGGLLLGSRSKSSLDQRNEV